MQEKERDPATTSSRSRWGPLAGGVILDLVDLVTYGPMGLYGGFLLGGLVGWWVGNRLGMGPRGRLGMALGAAIYSATPATEMVPLGTLLGVLVGLRDR